MFKQSHFTDEEFVSLWQKAKSPAEVANKLKLSYAAACSRAYLLRKKGVRSLKRFPHGTGPKKTKNISALQRLAAELA